MSRKCPTCDSQSVPWARLMLAHRTKCKSCSAKLGLHWLFAGVLYTVIFTVFFISALIVQVRFGFLVGAAIYIGGFLVIGGVAARLGPLEVKTKWWAP